MKQLAIAIICFLSSSTTWAQPTMTSLENDLATYYQYNIDLKYDSIVNYVNPGVIKLVSKESFVELLKETYSDDEVEITLDSIYTTKSYPIQKIDNTHYAIADYTTEMAIKVILTEGEDPDEFASILIGIYQSMYGEENVNYDSETGIYNVKDKKTLVAEYINDRWTFMNLESGLRFLTG